MLATSVALGALRTRTLSTSGAIAGIGTGAVAITAGWSWGILLLLLFISASALSRFGERRKADLVYPVVEKRRDRDAGQVLANGGVFLLAALAFLAFPSAAWHAVGIGALAASAADTWATEVGTLSSAKPISITSGQRVPTGTSGGITMLGTLAGLSGAIFMALGATVAGWPVSFAAVLIGGMAGAVSDSVLGATLQTRRWCDRCAESTERLVHSCNTPTMYAGGIRGFNNDVVNAVCSGVGALVCLLLS